MSCVAPHPVVQDRRDCQCRPVGQRGSLGTSAGEVLRDQSGWEWYEGDEHQEENVDEQERAVGVSYLVEHGVMVDPHDADRDEAEAVRRVARPDVQQLVAEVRSRGVEVEDEQRRRNGEDAVAERQESRCRHGRVMRSAACRA